MIINEADQMLDNTREKIFTEYASMPADILGAAANILSYNPSTLMEEAVLESTWERLLEDHKNSCKTDFEEDVPAVTPYFTPDEYRDLFPGVDIEDFDYLLIQDRDRYLKVITGLQKQLTNGDLIAEKKLAKLGWNPYVEISDMTLKYARSRQVKWLNENKGVEIINVSHLDTNIDEAAIVDAALEPIYICLVYAGTIFSDIINWWKKSKYSHAALSLDAKLTHMYSFNRNVETGESGFFEEGIQDYKNPKMNGDALLCVIAAFVTKEQKKKIEETIEWYKANKRNTSYSFKNIARIVFNKTSDTLYSLSMVCSQFVDNILKIANIDIVNGKSNNLVSPEDFAYCASPENKTFIVYEGLKTKYQYKKIEQKIKGLLKTLSKKDSPKITKKDLVINMKEATIDSFNVLGINGGLQENILNEAISLLQPSSILMEVKRIPVGFNKKGDMYIDTPKDLELEYKEAHKLLSVYDESNIQGMKHELARLFYLNSIIEKKTSKMKDKGSSEYKELIKLKARVMNDFTKYMKIVMKAEPEFDFSNYIKGTEYYNKTVIIGTDTLRYSGSYIKKALKLLGQ